MFNKQQKVGNQIEPKIKKSNYNHKYDVTPKGIPRMKWCLNEYVYDVKGDTCWMVSITPVNTKYEETDEIEVYINTILINTSMQ